MSNNKNTEYLFALLCSTAGVLLAYDTPFLPNGLWFLNWFHPRFLNLLLCSSPANWKPANLGIRLGTNLSGWELIYFWWKCSGSNLGAQTQLVASWFEKRPKSAQMEWFGPMKKQTGLFIPRRLRLNETWLQDTFETFPGNQKSVKSVRIHHTPFRIKLQPFSTHLSGLQTLLHTQKTHLEWSITLLGIFKVPSCFFDALTFLPNLHSLIWFDFVLLIVLAVTD